MSTLGKVLAFFNVIFAIVFLVFAGMDYGKQQQWSYAELRFRLAIAGLPVNETDIDEREPDDPKVHPFVERLPQGVLKQVFEGADGGPTNLGLTATGTQSRTLFEEVDRVGKKVRENVTGADAARQKLMLQEYLIPLAKTSGEREEYRKIINGPDGINKGLNEIDRIFADAKTNAQMGNANKKELRAKIADVLVNVSSDDPWRKRVMVVVGMEAFIDALNRQADNYMAMVANVQVAMAADQAAFERLYADQVLVIQLESDDLERANAFLANLKATAAARAQQVALRTTEKTGYETRLAEAREETKSDVKRLNAIQSDLFQLQQKAGIAMKVNQDLESLLRSLEQNKR
jgi:hypothetical protein